MNVRICPYVIFVISGAIWYFIYQSTSIIIRRPFHIHYEISLLELLSAIITSIIVGTLFFKAIIQFKGSKWYWLPIYTLSVSTIVFGFLMECIRYYYGFNGPGWITNNFLNLPLVYLFYSLTYFIWFVYPLALLTQYLIRFMLLKKPIKAQLK